MQPVRTWFLYVQCYFVSIATCLSSGILGLPVTLYQAGFIPFLATFSLGYVMQILVIFLMVEIIQYCYVAVYNLNQEISDGTTSETELIATEKYKESGATNKSERKNGHTKNYEAIQDDGLEEAGASSEIVVDLFIVFPIYPMSYSFTKTGYSAFAREKLTCMQVSLESSDSLDVAETESEPNLHIMGKLFLNKYLHPIYLLTLFLECASMCVVFTLAGAQAYQQLFKVNFVAALLIFFCVLSFAILAAHQPIQPVVAGLTLVKGCLLFLAVAVAIYAGITVNRKISNNWAHVERPFLMGTVALGGLPLVMPLLFSKFERSIPAQVKGYRSSLIAGVTTCYLLNVVWCWATLKVVPQTFADCEISENIISVLFNYTTTSTMPTDVVQTTIVSSIEKYTCNPVLTLQYSEQEGQIATVPLVEIIWGKYIGLRWIAIVVQLFIAISVSVSYLTYGSAIQHTICGLADDMVSKYQKLRFPRLETKWLPQNWFWHYLMGAACFAIIFSIAWFDPKGFLNILEKIASFGINLISGPFLFIMYLSIKSEKYKNIKIPLPAYCWFNIASYIILIFFTFAIVYDVVTAIQGLCVANN